MTVAEYREHLVTEKWCTGCHAWHHREEFDVDRSRGDGLASSCREARRRWQRIPLEKQKPKGGPKGWHHTDEAKARIANAHRGRTKPSPSMETRAKISATLRLTAARGPACHSYKDGRAKERRDLRNSVEYKRWRYDVFLRDAFTCQNCGDDRGGNLVAHHLRPWALFPGLRFEIDNGITWCRPCHDAHHREHGYDPKDAATVMSSGR